MSGVTTPMYTLLATNEPCVPNIIHSWHSTPSELHDFTPGRRSALPMYLSVCVCVWEESGVNVISLWPW